MFHMLTSVQDGGVVTLQQCIENQKGDLRVGLRQITYTVGWYNIGPQQSLSWRGSGSTEHVGTLPISPGLYRFPQLWNRIRKATLNFSLKLNRNDGLVTMRVPEGWEVQFSDGLLSILGLDDGLHGSWLDHGTYTGDRAANFTSTKMLQVHLDQLNPTGNFIDGAPSTLLAAVEIASHMTLTYGDVVTTRFECPEFKCLRNGYISELKVTIRDDSGKILNNHSQTISVVLDFQSCSTN